MYSSTPSFDSSLVLNDSGSSSTSPSRLPRMLVEYQPATPSIRALKAGESTVFIIVWPVLKSLPPMGRWRSSASFSSAGTSTVRLGAPFANGTPSMSAAQAYSIDGALLEGADVLAQLVSELTLGLAALDVGAVEPLDVVLIERGGHRGDGLEKVRHRLQMVRLEPAGRRGGGVGVVGNGIPRGEHE